MSDRLFCEVKELTEALEHLKRAKVSINHGNAKEAMMCIEQAEEDIDDVIIAIESKRDLLHDMKGMIHHHEHKHHDMVDTDSSRYRRR